MSFAPSRSPPRPRASTSAARGAAPSATAASRSATQSKCGAASAPSSVKFVVAPLGFVANGAGELAAAAVFMWRPSLCGFVHQPLDPNALFLFKAWALSIAGFATMTISAASDAEHAPERTEAITCGAILYHGTVAVCYVKHFRDGVLLHDWLGGAALHCLGLAFFSYHLWAHVYAARREAWIEARIEAGAERHIAEARRRAEKRS